MATRHTFMRFTICPVLDDDGNLQYWDIHEPDDPDCNGEPVAEFFAKIEDAKNWIRTRICDERLERLFGESIIKMKGHIK